MASLHLFFKFYTLFSLGAKRKPESKDWIKYRNMLKVVLRQEKAKSDVGLRQVLKDISEANLGLLEGHLRRSTGETRLSYCRGGSGLFIMQHWLSALVPPVSWPLPGMGGWPSAGFLAVCVGPFENLFDG